MGLPVHSPRSFPSPWLPFVSKQSHKCFVKTKHVHLPAFHLLHFDASYARPWWSETSPQDGRLRFLGRGLFPWMKRPQNFLQRKEGCASADPALKDFCPISMDFGEQLSSRHVFQNA